VDPACESAQSGYLMSIRYFKTISKMSYITPRYGIRLTVPYIFIYPHPSYSKHSFIAPHSPSPTAPCVPGSPAVRQAPKISSTISSTPWSFFMLVKIVGPSPRMSFESRLITSRDAPTYCAMSILNLCSEEV
jgi:hypothetical protein